MLGNSQSCLEIATEEFNGKHCLNIVDVDPINNTKNSVADEDIVKGIKIDFNLTLHLSRGVFFTPCRKSTLRPLKWPPLQTPQFF